MRHIEIRVVLGIPDSDYVDPSEVDRYLQEDIINWFDSCFYDGDSEGRVKLLDTSVDTDYKIDFDNLLIDEEEFLNDLDESEYS